MQHVRRTEHMIVVRVRQKNIVQRAAAEGLANTRRHGRSRKAEAGIHEDRGLAVVNKKRAVARDLADVGYSQVVHTFSPCWDI